MQKEIKMGVATKCGPPLTDPLVDPPENGSTFTVKVLRNYS